MNITRLIYICLNRPWPRFPTKILLFKAQEVQVDLWVDWVKERVGDEFERNVLSSSRLQFAYAIPAEHFIR